MIVLGFDTATPSTAIGLGLADGSFARARDDPPPGAHPGHATRLLGLAGRLLAEAGLRWGDLERIAVGLGPGTFTGLRVGVATARGLAQSLGVELVGVSSLRALALPASRACAEPGDRVLAVLDARRGEVFAGAYAPGGPLAGGLASGGLAVDGLAVGRSGDRERARIDPRELLAPRVLAPTDLDLVLEQATATGGRPGVRWLAVGDGALRFRDELRGLGVEVSSEDSPLHRIGGEAICELAALAPAPAQAIEAVLPDYLRRPDAELALELTGASRGARR